MATGRGFSSSRSVKGIDHDETVSGVRAKYCTQHARVFARVVRIGGEECIELDSTPQSHRVKSNQIYLQLLRLNQYWAKSNISPHVCVVKNGQHTKRGNMSNGIKVI